MAPLACWSTTYTSKVLTKWHIENGSQEAYTKLYRSGAATNKCIKLSKPEHSAFWALLDDERRNMFG